MWYPKYKDELESTIKQFLNKKSSIKSSIKSNIKGLLVPHAGYSYSGPVAGTAFSLLKNKNIKKAIIIGPSHYKFSTECLTHYSDKWFTPIGEIKTFNSGFPLGDLSKEHSIDNQIPFLQVLGIEEIMPLMVGDITNDKAKLIAEKISKINAVYIFSSDLSHFLPYKAAKEIDKETIEIIQSLDTKRFNRIDACGIYPILILFHLCKIFNTHPHLIEYKNSGDITNEKTQVVGYSSMWF